MCQLAYLNYMNKIAMPISLGCLRCSVHVVWHTYTNTYMEQHSNQLYGYTHPQLLPLAHSRVCVCVCLCVGMFILYFFGVAKTKFHGIARGRDGKRGGPHLTPSLTSSQTKLNIKQSALYCRLTRHENMHAIGWKQHNKNVQTKHVVRPKDVPQRG